MGDLEDAHRPFIEAMRSIVLSPFFILLVLIIVFIIGTMIAGMVEMILLRTGLIRENPYAKVSCVATRDTYFRKAGIFTKGDEDHSKCYNCTCFCCNDEEKTEGERDDYPQDGGYYDDGYTPRGSNYQNSPIVPRGYGSGRYTGGRLLPAGNQGVEMQP